MSSLYKVIRIQPAQVYHCNPREDTSKGEILTKLAHLADLLFIFQVIRNGIIGFIASAASDIISNSIRVVKILRQTSHRTQTYSEIISQVVKNGGIMDLFFRGIGLRILANGFQSMLFTVIWRGLLEEKI